MKALSLFLLALASVATSTTTFGSLKRLEHLETGVLGQKSSPQTSQEKIELSKGQRIGIIDNRRGVSLPLINKYMNAINSVVDSGSFSYAAEVETYLNNHPFISTGSRVRVSFSESAFYSSDWCVLHKGYLYIGVKG